MNYEYILNCNIVLGSLVQILNKAEIIILLQMVIPTIQNEKATQGFSLFCRK